MKKDRNCGGSYPVYPQMVPNYGGVIAPGQVIPLPGMPGQMSSYDNLENQVNYLSNRVNSLEQRVSSLESMVNNSSYSNNYNSSNYQMM